MRVSGTITTTPEMKTSAPTQTGGAQGTLGTRTAQPTRGQTIRRNIADFFKGIGKAFVSLHNRVQAHQAQQKAASNTRAANSAAKDVLKSLGKDTTEAKLSAALPKLLAKAARLNPHDPVAKAVELLNAVAVESGKGGDIEKINWKAMEPTIERMIDFRMGRSRSVEQNIVDIGIGVQDEVTTRDDIKSTKGSVRSLLTALQQKTDARTQSDLRSNVANAAKQANQSSLDKIRSATTFEAKLGLLDEALNTYLGGEGVKPGTVFRSDAPITNAIKEILKGTDTTVSGRLDGELKKVMTTVDSAGLPDELIGAHDKLREDALTTEQFDMVLDVARHMTTQLMGGTTDEGIKAAANRLPKEAVQVLQLIDAKLRERFPGEDTIAANAFVGSLFLRFQVPLLTTTTVQMEGSVKEKAIARLANAVTLTTFNAAAAGQAAKTASRYQPEVSHAYDSFVASFTPHVESFYEAVMAREID